MGRKAGALLMEASKRGEGDGGAYESNGVPCQGAASPWHGENETTNHHHLGRKIYMYALTKPHGSCRGSGGSDMHKQIKKQNRDIKHPTT